MTDTGEPSEATKRLAKFLDTFVATTDDEKWRDVTEALFISLVRQLMLADDPHAAIDTAIELLEYGHKRV